MTVPALALPLLAALAAASAPPPAATAGKEPSREGGERLLLTFAWPAAAAGTCEWIHTQARAGKPLGRFSVRFRMAAAAEGDGRRIVKKPLSLPEVDGEIARAVADLWPGGEAFAVDARGRFARYEELEGAVGAMDGALAPLSADLGAASRARLTDAAREALPRRARDEWSPWVGFWAGARLEPGVPRVEEVAAAGTRSRARLEYRADGRVPCDAPPSGHAPRPAAPAECVRLVLRTTWTDSAGGGSTGPLSYEEESVLVTDPETLRPRTLERRRVGRVEGQKVPVLEKRWTIRCRW